MIKDPCRGKGWNAGIEGKPMIRLRWAILKIIGEAVTRCKLEWGDSPNIMVIAAVELNAKMTVKEVGVRRAIKLRVKTIQ
jgi:hypothetical protein